MNKTKRNSTVVTALVLGLALAGLAGRGLWRLCHAGPAGGLVAAQTLTDLQQRVYHVAFSPDGKTLATAGGWFHLDSELFLWDLENGRKRLALSGHLGAVRAVAFSGDGSVLASSGVDRTVRLWDPYTGRELAVLGQFPDPVFAMALSPDGTTLAFTGLRLNVQIWDVPTRQQRCTVQGYGHLAFSPDGRTLAIGHENSVKLWDVQTGAEQASWTVGASWVRGVAYAHDGNSVAVIGDDAPIEIWDVASRSLRQTLSAADTVVAAVAFSPDGRLLASAGEDRTIHLWDLSTGQVSGVLSGHHDQVSTLAFSPDGNRIASGSHDKTVRLWSMPKEI